MEPLLTSDDRQRALIEHSIARLRIGISAVVTAMVAALVLFVATLWLVIKGGPNVGQHLGLLRAYYPGYSVTWTGSLLGLVYGGLTGFALGGCVAWLYNLIAGWRAKR